MAGARPARARLPRRPGVLAAGAATHALVRAGDLVGAARMLPVETAYPESEGLLDRIRC